MEVRRDIFVVVRAAGMIRSTEDKVYSILADALPIGNGRCQKRGERHAVCDACLARRTVARVRDLPQARVSNAWPIYY